MYNARNDFSENYAESRAKFKDAVRSVGTLHSVKHPEAGPDGGPLYLDFGVIGPDDASAALVLISGTHGPELFAGSGPQTALINSGIIKDYSDLKVILIHAHNPYGCAWLRRTDHKNIDLNRNYYDFSIPFTPQQMEGMLPKLTRKQKIISVIDFHTGLGPYGVPYIVHGYEVGSPEFIAFKKAYEGEVKSTLDPADIDEDLPGSPEGPIVLGMKALLPGKETYAVVIEYGTVPPEQVFPALMQDNWTHLHETPGTPAWNAVKQNVRETFYPLGDDWKDMIWEKAVWSIACSAKLARGETG